MTLPQIPMLSILGMALTLIISLGLPLAMFFYCRKNFNVKTSSLVFGAIIYYICAKLLEPFINAAILNKLGGAMMNNIFVYAAYVALIAAGIEEFMRYLGIKTLLKERNAHNAVYFGLGFGGFEAISIAAWPQISNILNSLLINDGTMAASLQNTQEPDLSIVLNTLSPLWETSSLTFIMAGFERALTLLMHICLSILILSYVNKSDKKCLLLAFIGHFAVVFCSALLGQMDNSLLSIVSTAAVTMLLIVFASREYKALSCEPGSEVIGFADEFNFLDEDEDAKEIEDADEFASPGDEYSDADDGDGD